MTMPSGTRSLAARAFARAGPEFVLGTCRKVVRDRQRRSHRQEQLLVRFGGDLVPEPTPLPTLEDDQLTACVQALKERERSVVVMTFYDEQTAAKLRRFSESRRPISA
jgi:hypothetical protein